MKFRRVKIIEKVLFLIIVILLNSSAITYALPLKPLPNTITVTEDIDYVFSVADFPFTGGTGTLVAVVIRSLPAAGTLYFDANLNGVVDGGELVIANFSCPNADLPKLKYKPLPDVNGAAYTTFTYDIDDGATVSAKNVTITVDITPVNDAPTGANALYAVNEDVNYVFAAVDFGYNDIDTDAFTSLKIISLQTFGFLFLDANSNGINDAEDVTLGQVIAVADIPKLTFVSALNENGSPYSQFDFQVFDGTVYSATYTIIFNVNPVNDAPIAVANTVVTIQDNDFLFAAADFSFSDVDGDLFVQLRVTSIPALGTLWVDSDLDGTINGVEVALVNNDIVGNVDIPKLTFKPNVGESGTPYTTFVFDVFDGTVYSISTYTMTIDVTPVNVEPSFTVGPNQSVPEDSPLQTVNPWATAISPGPASEAGQVLTFYLSNDNNSLFTVQPACSSSGILTYTPAPDAFGTANVAIYLMDDGGTANGGDDTSPTQNFTIELTAVNDAPVINNQSFNIDENSANGTVVGTTIASDVDLDALNYSITAGNTNLAFAINALTGQIIVNNSAELDYETTVSYSLTVNVFDGTVNSSATVTININNINDIAPTLNASVFGIPEGSPNGTVVGTLSFSEPEGDPLTFSITAGNVGGAFTVNSPSGDLVVANSAALNFEVTPVFTLTVKLSDGGFNVTNTITVNIANTNDPPRFTSTPQSYAIVGSLYTYNIITVDDDGDPITITCPVKPAWLSSFIDNGDGTATLSGTPTVIDVGNNNVQVKATDGIEFETQEYIITVAASVINVPADYVTIQGAIDAVVDGDIILVADGTYTENIDFTGKNITIIGNTADPSQVTIDGGASGSVVTFSSGETSNAILNGFTITNGTGTSANHYVSSFNSPVGIYGGGIYCVTASPTLDNLIVTVNSVAVSGLNGGSGGGIYFGKSSNAVLKNSQVSNNTSTQYRGGGICIDKANITINNTTISNNSGGNYGGGISVWNSSIILNDVSVSQNSVNGNNGLGGGIFLLKSTQNLTNVPVFNNSSSKSGVGVYSYGSTKVGSYSGADEQIIIP